MLELPLPDLDESLLKHLAGLDETGLAAVLRSRPDVLDPPWPRRLDDLVHRLSEPESIVLALRALPAPALQVYGAVRLVANLRDGDAATRDEVAGWLGAEAAELGPFLDRLIELALLLPEPGSRVRVPESHQSIDVDVTGLGPPVGVYLPDLSVADLRQLCGAFGIATDGRKALLVERLLAFYRDPARVRALLDSAPSGTEELLHPFTWSDPTQESDDDGYDYVRSGTARSTAPRRWAVQHGLLWTDYDGTATMPLEVGLALRGPDHRLPFAPSPPPLLTTPVTAEQTHAVASAAALRLTDRIGAVLEHAVTRPIALLKSGRVGSRAITALAKETGSSVEETRLALELAIRQLLLGPAEPDEPTAPTRRGRSRSTPPPPPVGLVPTKRYAGWQAAGPAARLRAAVAAWWTLPLAPLADEKTVRSVLGGDPSMAYTDIRQLTVRLLADLPDGTGAHDQESLAALAGWRLPMAHPDLLGALVTATLAESALLGVTGSGAIGDLGLALLSGTSQRGGPIGADDPGLIKATDHLVAGARTTALFGADLTAVVTGPPGPELAALLDRVARRESSSAASTWRFSPATVRAALDSGVTPAALLDELAAVAERPLPQPLVYLVNDVARRHGEVAVLPAGSVVLGDEPGLLAEIAAHRKLAGLGLRAVAPTVLVAAAAAGEVLPALRAAGYAPVVRETDGTVVVAAAPPPVARLDLPAEPSGAVPAPDPLEHAARLLRGPVRSTPSGRRRGALAELVYSGGAGKRSSDWMRLAWQLESGLPTRLDYREPDGTCTELVVSDMELDGDTLDVWCVDTAQYRRLDLNRVIPVHRGPG